MHTNAAHKAVHNMALAQRSSSSSLSSSSSVECISDSCSPPFYTPITTDTPTSALEQSPSNSVATKLLRKDKTGFAGEGVCTVERASSSTSLVHRDGSRAPSCSSTSSPPLLPAPSVSAVALSPWHKQIFDGRKLFIASPSSILGQMPSPLNPTPITIQRTPGSQSNMSSLLPPFPVTSLVPPQPKHAVTPLALPYPLDMNHIDLEKLNNINRHISSQVQTMPTGVATEGDSSSGAQVKACLRNRTMEWRGPSQDNAAMPNEFTHCVAGPAEVLQLMPFHQEHMSRLLFHNEHVIQCVDTQGGHRSEGQSTSESSITPGLNAVLIAENRKTSTTIVGNAGTKAPTYTAHHLSLTRESSQGPISSSLSANSTPSPLNSSVTSSMFTPVLANSSLSPNYLSSLLNPLRGFSQTTSTGTAGLTGSTSAPRNHVQAPFVPLLLQSPQAVGSPLNYCLLPASLQHMPSASLSSVSCSNPTASNVTTSTASTATGMELLQQSSPLISGLPTPMPMPQAGAMLLNNNALLAGTMNSPMYVIVPAVPSLAPVVQPLVPPSTAVLQVASSATLMLNQHSTAPMKHSIAVGQEEKGNDNSSRTNLRENSGIGRMTDSSDVERVNPPITRKRRHNLPDSGYMGEKIFKLVNPLAVGTPTSCPSFSGAVTNRNYSTWSSDVPGRSKSGSTNQESQEHLEDSSSESEESNQSSKSSRHGGR